MLQQPKKVKFDKLQKGKAKSSKNLNNSFPVQNKISLVSSESGILKSFEISAIKKIINTHIRQKKFYKIILHIFPHFSKTKKPVETRMGKGKGSLGFWFTKVVKGATICTIISLDKKTASIALKNASKRLSLKTFLREN